MNFQDGKTSFVVGFVHQYLTVKTPCTQQGGIEGFRTVGGSKYDNRCIGTKSVHLCKQLVECLFALIIAAHLSAGSSGLTNGIDFVNENDGRCLFFCLSKKVTYTAGTDTDEHFNEA